MRVLLIGSGGQLGSELLEALSKQAYALKALDREDLDITDPKQLSRAFDANRPNVVINAAAYTAVDLAESNASVAYAVNATAVGMIANECKRTGAHLIHYSTDYVFDGAKRSPYVETDRVNPLGVYGASKLQGEEAIRDCGVRHAIVRVAWLYSAHHRNFLLTVLRLTKEGKPLRIVNDQIGVPTTAAAVAEITMRMLSRPALVEGTFHFAPQGETSWHGFASEIVQSLGMNVLVEPIPTSAYPTAAKRPAYSVLSSAKLGAALGFEPAHWKDLLMHTLKQLSV